MPSTRSSTARKSGKTEAKAATSSPTRASRLRKEAASAPKQTETPPDSQAPSIADANISFEVQGTIPMSAIETAAKTTHLLSFSTSQPAQQPTSQAAKTSTKQPPNDKITITTSKSDPTSFPIDPLQALDDDPESPVMVDGIEITWEEVLLIQKAVDAKLARIETLRLEKRKFREAQQAAGHLPDSNASFDTNLIKPSDLPSSPVYSTDPQRNAILSGIGKRSLKAELDQIHAKKLARQHLKYEELQAIEDHREREFNIDARNLLRKRFAEEVNDEGSPTKRAKKSSHDDGNGSDEEWLALAREQGIFNTIEDARLRKASPTPGASMDFPRPPAGRSVKRSPSSRHILAASTAELDGAAATTSRPIEAIAPPPEDKQVSAPPLEDKQSSAAAPPPAEANTRNIAAARLSLTPRDLPNPNLPPSRVPTPSDTNRSRSPTPDPFITEPNRSLSVHQTHPRRSYHGGSPSAHPHEPPQTQFNTLMAQLAAQPQVPQHELLAVTPPAQEEDSEEYIPTALVLSLEKVYTDLAQKDFDRYARLRQLKDEFPGQSMELAVAVCEAMVDYRRAKAKAEAMGELIEQGRVVMGGEEVE